MRTIRITGQLGYLLRRAQQLNSTLWFQVVSEDITSLQFAALNSLREKPGIDQKTLGTIISMDRSTTAELVTRLVKKGLIATARDEKDNRRRLLALTPSGEALLEELLPRVLKLSRVLNKPLSSSDHRELKRLLTQFVEMLDPQTSN